MSRPDVTDEDKEAEFARFLCEIVVPLRKYIEFFKAVGIEVEPGELIKMEEE